MIATFLSNLTNLNSPWSSSSHPAEHGHETGFDQDRSRGDPETRNPSVPWGCHPPLFPGTLRPPWKEAWASQLEHEQWCAIHWECPQTSSVVKHQTCAWGHPRFWILQIPGSPPGILRSVRDPSRVHLDRPRTRVTQQPAEPSAQSSRYYCVRPLSSGVTCYATLWGDVQHKPIPSSDQASVLVTNQATEARRGLNDLSSFKWQSKFNSEHPASSRCHTWGCFT